MMSLGGWMNKVLIGWGIDPKFADMFDETIIALLMVGLSIGLDYLCQAIFVGGMKHYTRRSPHQWNTLLMKRRVIHHLIHILPGILIYYLLPMAFVRGKDMLEFSQKVCAVYIIVAVLLTINGLLLVMLDVILPYLPCSLRYKELFGHCSLLFEILPGRDRTRSARKPACYCTQPASARQILQVENVFSWFYF